MLINLPKVIVVLITELIDNKDAVALSQTSTTFRFVLDENLRRWLNALILKEVKYKTRREFIYCNILRIYNIIFNTKQKQSNSLRDIDMTLLVSTLGTCSECGGTSREHAAYLMFGYDRWRNTERFPCTGILNSSSGYRTYPCKVCHFKSKLYPGTRTPHRCDDCGDIPGHTRIEEVSACRNDECCSKYICRSPARWGPSVGGCYWVCWGCESRDEKKLVAIYREIRNGSKYIDVRTIVCIDCKNKLFPNKRVERRIYWEGPYAIDEDYSM